MNDKTTLEWLRQRALTVLAELMTSDDDDLALRAAATTLQLINAGSASNQGREERRVAITLVDHTTSRTPDSAQRTERDPQQPGTLPGSRLRAALGQD